jgi:replicative DNA helicase
MSETVTEESLAKDIAVSMGAAVPKADSESELESRFEFDAAFQTKITALVLKDPQFNLRTEGLIRPEFFENQAEGTLVNIGLEYFAKYKRTPDLVILMKLVKDGVTRKSIRPDLLFEVKKSIRDIHAANISDRDYVVDEVSVFARHQAMGQAILDSVEYVEKRNFDKAFNVIKLAMDVGAADDMGAYNYFEEIDLRSTIRKEIAAGTRRKRGITTGIRQLDKSLYHDGWGMAELTLLMGGPKSGKSTALAEFGKYASLAGFNVLMVTLEVSKEILAERLDANLADIAVTELGDRINEAQDKIRLAEKKAGALMINEFPTGTMTPAMLRRLIAKYKSQDMVFNMICVDYADIMAPNFKTTDPIENSKSIYIDLRAIAQEEGVALLTATQTNREGAKSAVAKMEHVAEDFNRVRIADLVISINRSEEERAKNEARLFFAASRNQKGEFTIRIKQDMEKMKFMSRILGFE